MEANRTRQKPREVRVAVWLLYSSLGIQIVLAFLTWLNPTPVVPVWSSLPTFLFYFSYFHFWSFTPGIFAQLLIILITAWLYRNVGTGKNWARVAVLIFVILEMLYVTAFGLFSARLGIERSGLLASSIAILIMLQHFVRIMALALLFGGKSSKWFRGVEMNNHQGITRTNGIAMVAVAGLVILLLVLVLCPSNR